MFYIWNKNITITISDAHPRILQRKLQNKGLILNYVQLITLQFFTKIAFTKKKLLINFSTRKEIIIFF